jgi:hypothetical protein
LANFWLVNFGVNSRFPTSSPYPRTASVGRTQISTQNFPTQKLKNELKHKKIRLERAVFFYVFDNLEVPSYTFGRKNPNFRSKFPYPKAKNKLKYKNTARKSRIFSEERKISLKILPAQKCDFGVNNYFLTRYQQNIRLPLTLGGAVTKGD